MRSVPGRWLALLLLASAACGGNDKSRLAETCRTALKLGPEACDCVADRAETELSSTARELLVAMLEKDDQRIKTLRAQLTIEDATRVAMFLVRAPGACAATGAEPPGDGRP